MKHNQKTAELLAGYKYMLLIRKFEEAIAELFERNLIGGTSHFCIGQEACAVGVVSETRETDYLVSNHRGHGHLLARGLDPARVLAELMGRSYGYCGGKGGSQHMCAMDRFFLGTNGITGGGIPIGAGAAYALQRQNSDSIVVVFFGDGASNQGTFHESLNMASLWDLPVLYVCENNFYAMSQSIDNSIAGGSVAKRAEVYQMNAEKCDGMNLPAIKQKSAEMIASVREQRRPMLLELFTYRFCGHSKNDKRVYRTREEEAEWQQRDCLHLTRTYLEAQGVSTAELDSVVADVEDEISEAVAKASAQPYGSYEDALGPVFAESNWRNEIGVSSK